MALISVVLPTYNSVATVERAIDSVFAQTFIDWELIVVDDASTDNTIRLVKERYGNDARVSILKKEINGGPAESRNMAISHATADWIALLDSDDAWSRDRLAILYASSDSFDFIADNIMTYDSLANTETGPLFEDFNSSILTLDSLLLGWIGGRKVNAGYLKPLMRSQFLRDGHLAYNHVLRHGEDFVLYCEALCLQAKFGLINHPGYIYTTEVGRTSQRSSPHSRTSPDPIAMSEALHHLSEKYSHSLNPGELDALGRYADGLARSKWLWKYEAARSNQQYYRCLKLIACHHSVRRNVVRSLLAKLGIAQATRRP